MRASRGASGSARMARPMSVSLPSPVERAEFAVERDGLLQAGAGGGSSHVSCPGSSTPQAARSSARPERSASRISGAAKAGSDTVAASSHSR